MLNVNFTCEAQNKLSAYTKRIKLTYFIILLFPILSHAQLIDDKWFASFDSIALNYIAEHRIPGIAIGIAKNGEIIRVSSYGKANIELNSPVIESSVFEIGSISKQFTAVAILQLLERNKISLDDSLGKFQFDIPQSWAQVTIKQLLNHSSGIPDYEKVMGYNSYRLKMTDDEVIDIVRSMPLEFDPGNDMIYSNTGYFILSMIIETIEEISFDQFLSNNIFKPLGMNSTGLSNPDSIIRNRVSGYQLLSGGLANRDPIQPMTTKGAGGIVSTVNDLLKWNWSLLHDQLLKPETGKMLWSPTYLQNGETTDYGFGLAINDYRGHPEIFHAGMTPGFVSSLNSFPRDSLSVVILSNLFNVGLRPLLMEIVHHYIPETSYVNLKPQSEFDKKTTKRMLIALNEIAGVSKEINVLDDSLNLFVTSEQFSNGRQAVEDWLQELKEFSFLKKFNPPSPHKGQFGGVSNEALIYKMRADYLASVHAQQLISVGKEKQIDSLFSAWNTSNTAGMSVGIIYRNKFIYSKAFGMANLELQKPFTFETVSYLASCSKQFTAFAILLLEEKGMLSIDDEITKHLTEFPSYGNEIKIHNLLNHTSGIRDCLSLQALRGKSSFLNYYSDEEIFNLILSQKELNFAPGEKTSYSNSNYFLLKVIIERTTGVAFDDFLKNEIFEPLRMNKTKALRDVHELIPGKSQLYLKTKT